MLEKGCQADVVFSLVFCQRHLLCGVQLGDFPAPIKVRVLSQTWASPGQSAPGQPLWKDLLVRPGDAIAGR